jgi:predicted metal-dependent enzyme (double-stranded beta helix superfamily)
MVGVMRGAEVCEDFEQDPNTGRLQSSGTHHLASGGIDLVSPSVGDIHQVSNAFTDRTSLSIHIYGANIGAVQRHVYDADTVRNKQFVSGYSNAVMPNLWDRSAE